MQQELSEVYFYLKGTLKYKRVAVVFALLISIGAWFYVYLMPDKYQSKARVHVDSTSILRPLMRGMIVEPDVKAIIGIIQQLMFTRPNLEKIVEISSLKPNKPGVALTNDFFEQFKKDILIAGGRGGIYDIGYSAADAETAQSVVQAVLTVFSEQTQGKALSDTSDAQKFIEQQIRDYEIRLQDAEKAKEEFKRENLDLLNNSDQFAGLQRMKDQLQDATTALQQAISRRDALGAQVKEVQDSDQDWSITESSKVSSADNARIEALKDKRTELLLKYTERHPGIVEIDKLIETLKQQEEVKKEAAAKEVKTTDDVSDFIGPQKMSNPYVQSLKINFDNAKAEVASLESLVESIRSRITKLEEGLNERLTIETQMKNLNRDYETINAKYSELLERREQAHITERIDDQTSRLKFKIADPATRPTKPTYPNRKLYYSLILISALALGFGLAFLIYFIRPVFMSAKQVRVVTGLPSLGSISLTSQGISRTNNRDWPLISTMAVLLASYVGIMLFEVLK